MFYLSAAVVIIGVVSYHFLVKLIPSSVNPIVSVSAVYAAVLLLSLMLLPFFPPEGGLAKQLHQLNWIQPTLAVSVWMIELGFLLMYRYGWTLSTGNLITGVIINVLLVGLGVALLGEKITVVDALGVGLSVLGIAFAIPTIIAPSNHNAGKSS